MKKNTIVWTLALLVTCLYTVGCSSDEPAGSSKVGNVKNSACLRDSRTESVLGNPTLTLTRDGNNLYCQLNDYLVNCAFGDVQVFCEEKGQALNISVDEGLGEVVAKCICPINISFTIFDALQDNYQLFLNGRLVCNVSFKEHRVTIIDLQTLAVTHEEGFE